ncbi:hypothetical protein EDB81DRAFT_864428 [Dactylonectria macrodidyma]|uniref:FAD-binding PCMH-type domain-containing protein n=1 Tax=Dactylonectria macrodidyma TaxID=307937 RepID=A0A9P9FW33_9HYPO|nr:hypothetical protein EDB81DRAFT_864428 [Dactylonectria macrodidyma]
MEKFTSNADRASAATVRVGPGVRWGPLLQTLEKEGVIAVGGRDFGVGVPGFVFGGGLSYLSAQYGWGIDNLVSSDIVLANGDLITVDSASHPDLNQALRGGGAHNFGIVTSLTLKIYPYKGMWGGVNVVAEKHFDAFFDEYDTYTRNLVKDGKAHMILDFVRKDGEMVAAQFVGYPDSLPNPHIYDGFRRIPSVMNTLRLADYSALAAEVAEVTDSGGQRNGYWTTAMEYDINLLKAVYKLWAEKTETCRMKTVLDFNHITPGMRNKAAREGKRNLYGLEGPDEPLSNILLTATWDNESDDEEAASLLKSLGDAIDDLARRHGKSLQFRYMNYANQQQDVIAGLGAENKAFLIEVAAKYDPEAVFQKLQPGTFKIDASGSGTSIL